MSIQAIAAAIAIQEIGPTEKLLLIALANYADDKFTCWPSQVALARDTCLSERSIRTLMVGLEKRELVSREKRRRLDGSRASDLIILHLGPNQPANTAGSEEATGESHHINRQNPSAQPAESVSATGKIGADNRQIFPPLPEAASGLTSFEPSPSNRQKSPPIPPRGLDRDLSEIKTLTEAIWEATPIVGRRRSSRNACNRAVGAALRRGGAPDQILTGVLGYYASADATKDDAKFAAGVHRIIENDRWKEFLPEENPHGLHCRILNPGPRQQRGWARDWKERGSYGWLEHERGPPPGRHGCQIAPEILAEFGIAASRLAEGSMLERRRLAEAGEALG